MYQTDVALNNGKELLEKFGETFDDDSQLYRQTFAFIAVLAIENNFLIYRENGSLYFESIKYGGIRYR